jgi:hypothetical protein
MPGKVIISILLGLGLATLFRRACNERDCLIFRAPALDKIKGQIFKFENKCYSFSENAQSCDVNKKTVHFA